MPGSYVYIFTHTHTCTHIYGLWRVYQDTCVYYYLHLYSRRNWGSVTIGKLPKFTQLAQSASGIRAHFHLIESPWPPYKRVSHIREKDLYFLIPNDFNTSCLAPEARQPVSWVVRVFLGPPAHDRPSFSKFKLRQLIWVVMDRFWILRLLLPGPL